MKNTFNIGNLFIFEKYGAGIGLDKPNPWAFDTAQFDSILKGLKVVRISF